VVDRCELLFPRHRNDGRDPGVVAVAGRRQTSEVRGRKSDGKRLLTSILSSSEEERRNRKRDEIEVSQRANRKAFREGESK
jgi:hypothetical protein